MHVETVRAKNKAKSLIEAFSKYENPQNLSKY